MTKKLAKLRMLARLEAMTKASSLLGTEAALVSMLGNEGLTNVSYELALKLEWSAEERAVLEKNREDERRHLAWMKEAALHRPWARASAGAQV